MFAATPIYDALARELLGRPTDFTPHWPMPGRDEHPERNPAGGPRHELPRPAPHRFEPRGAAPVFRRRPQ